MAALTQAGRTPAGTAAASAVPAHGHAGHAGIPQAVAPRAAAVRALLAIDHHLTAASQALGCTLLAVVSVLGLWQVLARFLFSQPSPWTEELMRRLLIWAVMCGVVVAFRRGALVSVDLALRTSRGLWRTLLRAGIALASLAFLGVLLWFGTDLAWRVRFQTFASLELSMAWAYAALPVGAALSIVAVLAQWADPMNEELETAQ
jgi:TRAP-type C4-dicarboxylate transport system permease small subunit